jgi:beta-phosphoglucomutase-like phosphatase (HAD superfamily)
MMGAAAASQQDAEKQRAEDKPEEKKSLLPGAVNLLKGLFGH